MKITHILAVTAFVFLAEQSNAEEVEGVEKGKVETPILFSCSVSFHATGKSAYLILGYTHIEGRRTMSCYDFVENVVEEIPLKVTIKGPGAGLGVTGLNVTGGQSGIGINASPDALLGKYLIVRGNAAI